MQLVSILALLALSQGILARNLCKEGQRYCGSAFKQFDNAEDFQLDDNELYLCDNFKGTTPGTLGRVQRFRHYPVIVQTCPKTCNVEGGDKDDYCTGEKLFNDNEGLAKCAEKQYKYTAKQAIKAKSKLALLKVGRSHYNGLLSCAYAHAKVQTIRNTDPEYRKQVNELLDDLWDGQKKAQAAVDAEEAKEAEAGKGN